MGYEISHIITNRFSFGNTFPIMVDGRMKKIKENWIEWAVKIVTGLFFGTLLLSGILWGVDCMFYNCNRVVGF